MTCFYCMYLNFSVYVDEFVIYMFIDHVANPGPSAEARDSVDSATGWFFSYFKFCSFLWLGWLVTLGLSV